MSLLKSIATVGSNTLVSRVLGLVRDIVFARVFGASAGTDAFFVAFKIPNFMRRLFAEGAFSQAFVPVLAEYRAQHDAAELKGFVDRVAGTLGGILLAVTVLGVLGAPLLVMLFAPGFIGAQDKFDLTVAMLRLTFPYLLFISLTALAGGILNTWKRFGVPAFTPVLLNLSLIGCALWLAPRMDQPIVALAWGVLIAGVAQLLFQLPFLRRLGLLPIPRFAPRDAGVRKIGRLMLPALFGVSVTQINLLIDTLIASFLVTGSVTWLYYSDRLVELPLGIFGIALSTVLLPNLSGHHANEDPESFSASLDWSLRWVFLVVTPAAVGLVTLAGPMLATLFHSAVFTGHDVAMASRSLIAYGVGLLGFSLIKVLAPGYYARQDTRSPVRIAVIAMLTNVTLNLILVFPLAHAGLALATSLAATLNAALLYRGLRRDGVYRPRPGWRVLLLRVALACGLMGGLLARGAGGLEAWVQRSTMLQLAWLLAWIGCGVLVYFGALWLLGVRPRDFRGAGTT